LRLSRSTLLTGIAALAVVGLLVWLFRPTPVLVDVGRVERGTLLVTVDEEAETRVRERFAVAAPVTGRLERIALDAGDAVERGTVVARVHPIPLDPRALAEAQARLEAAVAMEREAEARVHRARAALEQARRSARRARELAAAGALSDEARERAELEALTGAEELEAAEFAARAARFESRAARAALMAAGEPVSPADGLVRPCGDRDSNCLELRSPVKGRVLRVLEESERIVAAGLPVIELGDPAEIEIVVDVLSTDAVKVKAGAPVLIENWGGDEVLRGRVRLVEPSGFTKVSALGVEEQRVNVIVDLPERPESLGDGYRLDARIVVWEGADVLKVPAGALFRYGEAWSVFVVEAGRARRREVEIGQRSAREAELKSGLREGDLVILHPSDQVEDGVRIERLARPDS
jgi:HlyD family secretion protein